MTAKIQLPTKFTPPLTAEYAGQQSLPPHKNPLNTAPQQQARKDA